MKSILLPIFSIYFVFVSVLAHADGAAKKPAESSPEAVAAVFDKFKKSESFKLSVTKVSKTMFGKDKTYEGTIEVLGDLFRWENKTPTESLILFDGQRIWTMDKAHAKGKVVVTKKAVDKDAGAEQPIFKLLRRKEPLNTQFKIQKHSAKEKSKYEFFELSPLSGEWTIQNLIVTLDPKNKELKGIRYEDEIGNKTFLQFSNIKLGASIKKERFEFSPPSGAEVTEI